MLKLFKTNNIEVLYNSKSNSKSDELKNKIVEQIMNLQILTRGSYSSEEFDSAPKANSNELTELFSKVVEHAKNDSQIDYLVCAIPQKINARPLARAGFNAKLFKNSYFHSSGIINKLSNYIILNSEEKLSKSEILSVIRSEEQYRKTLFRKGEVPKSLSKEIRIISENRKFIEKSEEPHTYYYGLITGLNVRK